MELIVLKRMPEMALLNLARPTLPMFVNLRRPGRWLMWAGHAVPLSFSEQRIPPWLAPPRIFRETRRPHCLPFPTLVPHIQRRVAACLNEVDMEPAPVPFIPHGCPFAIHNPFTARSQCKVMSEVVHTPQGLRNILADYAARRGWQPLVCVQPQPTDDAVHLIPAAADPGLVAVLFRAGRELVPSCIGRTVYGHPYCRLDVHGRAARLREPYPIARGREGSSRLRDGDCLHADVGPYGPPPPEPVHSQSPQRCRFPFLLLAAVALRSGSSGVVAALMWGLMPTNAVQIVAPEPVESREARYVVGHFPWRQTPADRTLSVVCRHHRCRISLLCPWTGPQGVFQCRPDCHVQDLWERYAEAGEPADYVPIWPCLSDDRLWIVPRAIGGYVCVVARQDTALRSLFIPADVSYARLCRTLQHLTGWDLVQARVPPPLHAQQSQRPSEPVHLRDGDVIDVIASRQDCRDYEIFSQSEVKDHVLWTRGLVFRTQIAVRIWIPELAQPILTWLEEHTRWDPVTLTFSGGFNVRYPGSWVPAIWTPCKTPQLLRVAGP